MAEAVAFARAALAVADAIGVHDFSLRERRVLEVLRRVTFGAARLDKLVPSRSLLARAARISEGNLHEVLGRLKRCLVIEERPDGFFGFRLPIEHWRVPLGLDLAALEGALGLEATPHWQQAQREVFVESRKAKAESGNLDLPTRGAGETSRVVWPERSRPGGHPGEAASVASRESAGSQGNEMAAILRGAESPPISSNQSPGDCPLSTAVHLSPGCSQSGGELVPDSGTARPRDRVPKSGTVGGSRIGNRPANPRPVRSDRAVPESGTVAFKALRVSTVQSSETAEALRALKGSDRELLRRLAGHVGERTWLNWGGAWTNLVKRDAALVERIVVCYEAETRAGRVVGNPGGWMWDLSKRWRAGR